MGLGSIGRVARRTLADLTRRDPPLPGIIGVRKLIPPLEARAITSEENICLALCGPYVGRDRAGNQYIVLSHGRN